MEDTSSQREDRYKPGVKGWLVMLLVGIICAAFLPIVPLVASATFCGMGFLCILVDNSPWVAGITAFIGFVGGMYLSRKLAEHSHKRKFEEQPLQPEMTRDLRQHQARMAWLDDIGRRRH